MKLEGEQTLLRIHLSNFARWHTQPLYEALVDRARREHLAGATVLKGMWGYIGNGPLLGEHPHALSIEQPVVVEIVDGPGSIDRFLEAVASMLAGHHVLITTERAAVIRYLARSDSQEHGREHD